MTDELPVHISREEIHDLAVPESFSAEGTFDVVFRNHGQSVHVHVHLEGDLAAVASIDASNHYVEGESQRAVRINVNTDRLPDVPVTGKLKLVSAYGATTRWVDVEVTPPVGNEGSVEVDESLAEPQPRDEDDEQTTPLLDSPELQVIGLGAFAVAIAVLVAVLVQDALVMVGALGVLAGLLVAVYLVVQ